MDALVMCGGEGSRLDAAVEKPLFRVGGEPMVDRVLAALAGSRVETVHVAVSPNAPETAAHLAERADVAVIETAGEGYVADLGAALDRVGTPVLTVAADIPLLGADAVDTVLAAVDADCPADPTPSLTVTVPAVLKRELGVSVDAADQGTGPWVPTGVNVVGEPGAPERTHRSWDARLAVNVNRKADARVAELLLTDGP